MKNLKRFGGLFLGFAAFAAGCNSNLTTVGNPRGLQTQVTLTNEIDTPSTAGLSAVTVETGSSCRSGSGACYTPSIYSLGFRSFSLLQCLASGGAAQACPGESGEEIESALGAGESIDDDLALLNSEVANRAIFQGDEALTGLGDLLDLTVEATDSIESAGLYSGFQSVLDFIMTQVPADKTPLEADFAFLCLNRNGCSSLSSYPASFGGLAGSGALFGDILFFRLSDATWHFFNAASDSLVNVTNGRPASPLSQGDFPEFDADSTGAIVYNASFGDVPPIDIEEADLGGGGTVDLSVVFSVENAMSFQDANANGDLDLSEIETLTFGKPRIVTFEVN